MATNLPNPPKERTTTFPARRGRVKAQIFESLAAEMSSLASRTGKVFSRLKIGDATSATSTAASAATTPPTSAYASDGDTDDA